MKRFLFPILAALALPNAVNANVDPEIAEFCMKAADFQGCVKAMTTKPTNSQNMRIIRGETEVTGNTCPDNHAYTGGGYCQRVMCDGLNWWVREFSARHDPLLEGKGWECQGQKKLMLTGDKFGPCEGIKNGFLDKVFKNEEEMFTYTDQLIKKLNSSSPNAIKITKNILISIQDSLSNDFSEIAAQRFYECMLHGETLEGLNAFLDKRKPKWDN